LLNELARTSAVGFNISVANAGGTLTVSGPDGRVFRNEFPAGAAAEFSVIDSDRARLPDGTYNYELRLTAASLDREALKASRGKDDDPEAKRAARKPLNVPDLVQSGSFAISNQGAAERNREFENTATATESVVAPATPVGGRRRERFGFLHLSFGLIDE
jgi:hypothetical protein